MLGKKVNILVLTLLTLLSTATFAAVHTQYSTTVCSNQPYLFGCDTYTANGAPSNTLVDSTVTVNLTFGSQKAAAYTATIEPGQKYLFGCKQLTADGDVWSNTLQQLACGCDSTVTVTLQVQAAPPAPTDIAVEYAASIYTGQAYLFGCTPYYTSGSYTHTLPRVGGGDSIITLHLTVAPMPVQNVTVEYAASIYTGESYLFGCDALTAAGAYTKTLQRAAGGDSIINLTLSVNPVPSQDVTVEYAASIYTGESYLFGCDALTAAGAYTKTLQRAAGGDSIINLTLSVNPVPSQDVTVEYAASIYTGESYLFGCDALTAAGAYTKTLQRAAGGDSIINLTLSVNPVPSQDVTVEYAASIYTGESYLFGCDALTAAGAYTKTLQRAAGGDSIINLTLSVNPVPSQDVTVEYAASIYTGESYLFGCDALTAAGAYTKTLQRAAGGDSIINLTLSVNPVPSQDVTVEYAASIYTGESYLFGCDALTAAGAYTKTLQRAAGGDSIINLTLSVVPQPSQDVTVQYDTEIEVDQIYLLNCKQFQFNVTGPQTLKDTIARVNGGDSIIIVNLTVSAGGGGAGDTVRVKYDATINAGEKYLFGCRVLEAAGQYSDTLYAGPGRDSIVTVDLKFAPAADTIKVKYDATINPGEIYLFGCKTYNAAGTYADTLPRIGVLGDSIINLTLTIGCTNDTVYMTNPVIACGMYHWAIDDQDYVNSGTYYYDNGPITPGSTCHEYYELKLTILEPAHGADEVVGCDSVIFKGVKYTASTTVNDTLVGLAANGCDSIVTVTITVNQHATGTDAVEGCESVIFKGVTYTADAVVYDTIAGGAANGCDSIVAVTITVKHHAEGVDAIDGCESVTFKGVTYTADALVYDTIVGGAANGCDSIVAVTITIKHHAEGVDALEGCDSVIFKGVKYTADALVYDTIVGGAANGCDSIVAVTITVKHSTASEETAEACDSYEWNSNTYTASGDYTYTTTNAVGCDSVVTLHLTIHNSVATTEEAGEVCNAFYWAFADTLITNTGSYKHTEQTIYGCDSTVTLNVTINTPYVDTLEVRGYYGDRIIMINRNQINSIPGWNQALDSIDNGEGYVKWFKMQGATPDPENDPQVATGYFYTLETGDPLPAGMYYATVEIPASDAAKCGAMGTTEIYTVAGAAPAPALMPSLARPGEDIRVVNLDPKVETVIRVYTADGMLQQTFNVSEAESYTIQAGYNHGFYLVELVSDNMKSTLRYIVK